MTDEMNAHQATPSSGDIITAAVIPNELGPDFLRRHFDGYDITVESNLYRYMEHMVPDYDGGIWNFIELSNGGGYMSWVSDKTLKIEIPSNYFSGEFSPDGASIVVMLYLLCTLAEQTEDDQIIEHYHWLRDYAVRHHPEGQKIAAAID